MILIIFWNTKVLITTSDLLYLDFINKWLTYYRKTKFGNENNQTDGTYLLMNVTLNRLLL